MPFEKRDVRLYILKSQVWHGWEKTSENIMLSQQHWGEKLEKVSPQPHLSPLRKASPQPHFQGMPSPWKMSGQGCRNGRGPQMPIDVSCPHGDDSCGAYHHCMTRLVYGWHQRGFGMPWTATCYPAFQNELSARCQKSPLPGYVSSHWTLLPWCNMRQGDSAFHPCRISAPGCCLSALARCCCTSASAAAQRSVRCAFLSHSSNRDCKQV